MKHYFQKGSHHLSEHSGYLSWIYINDQTTVDYELCSAISAMSIKLCSPLVKNTAIVVPKNYHFKHQELKNVWNHIIEWDFNNVNNLNFWKDDLLILQHVSPFKYTIRLDSDVIITGSSINEVWHRVWRLGYAITESIADINGKTIANPYRSFSESPWMKLPIPNAYVAVMGVELENKKCQWLFRGWEWALRNFHVLTSNKKQTVDSDELLSLSIWHSNLVLQKAPFFVHAKPLCLFDSPQWPSSSVLNYSNNIWKLSHVPQHLPLHVAEKSMLNHSLAQQLWSQL